MPDSSENNVACRICMDPKDEYVSLFISDLSKKVMEIADVRVEKHDGLPENVCVQCEKDLEKCYEFRLKVQVADKKFRQNLKFSQVDIEECKIKEERYVIDDDSDNGDDKHSESMDEENYDEPDVPQRINEETEVPVPDPLNHVVVIEEEEKKVEMSENPASYDDSKAEEEKVDLQKMEEVSVNPLDSMKEETETEMMDIDGNQPDAFEPSSSVTSSESSKTNSILPEDSSRQLNEHIFQLCHQITPSTSLPYTLLTLAATSSVSPAGIILPINKPSKMLLCQKIPASVTIQMPSDDRSNQNHLIMNTNTVTSDTSLSRNSTNKTNNDLKSKLKNFNKKLKLAEVEKIIPTNNPQICDDPQSGNESYGIQISDSRRASSGQSGMSFKANNESFCSVCNVDCGNIELLQDHKERKGFICRRCTSSFDSHFDLEIHFISHTPFTCKSCGEVFYFKKDLFRHRNSAKCCEQLKYACEFCSKRFSRSTQLKSHMWTHKNVNEGSGEVCIVCKKNFKSSRFLIMHERVSHTVYEYMECRTCHKLLLGPTKLRHHIQTIHIEPSEHDKLSCPSCEKIFTNKSLLNVHIKEKHDDTQYVCEMCGHSITGKKAMNQHMRYKHANQPFSCTKCNQQFDSKGKLSTHRKHHIKKERPPKAFFCEICGKTYKSKEILKTHLRIHSDEKPFKCQICGAAFKQKVILMTHSRVHNSVGKYICYECGLSFNWKQSFDKHVKTCEAKESGVNNDAESS